MTGKLIELYRAKHLTQNIDSSCYVRYRPSRKDLERGSEALKMLGNHTGVR